MQSFSLIVLIYFLFIAPAYAYLDPGTGSMVFQMAIAGVLSIAFAIKTYWYKIKSILTGKKLEPLENINDDELPVDKANEQSD